MFADKGSKKSFQVPIMNTHHLTTVVSLKIDDKYFLATDMTSNCPPHHMSRFARESVFMIIAPHVMAQIKTYGVYVQSFVN